MSEAMFPLLGAAFVVLVVLPAFALITKLALMMLERDAMGGPLHGLSLRYVLLTASSVLPLAWFLSAGVHQVESGKAALACMFDPHTAEHCLEPGFFSLVLLLVMIGLSWTAFGEGEVRASEPSHELRERLERVLAEHPTLAMLRDRVIVTDDPNFTIGAHGLLKPRVAVGRSFAEQLSDDMLASALGHEREHVRSRDPLLYLLLRLALAVNPLGRLLLEPHAARWIAAREAHCDREAVVHGAAPLPLADAIVKAARPGPRLHVALGTSDNAILEFRIRMLLAFAERMPVHCCQRGPSALRVALVLLLIALVLPHQTGTAALDLLHAGVEQTITAYLWR